MAGGGVGGTEEGFCSPEKWEGTASGSGQKSQVLALDPMTFVPDKLMLSPPRISPIHWGGSCREHPSALVPESQPLGTAINLIKLSCPRGRLSQSEGGKGN